MLTRTLKLKFNKEQEKKAERYLLTLSSVYNWSLSKFLNSTNKEDKHWISLCDQTKGHASKVGIDSQVFQQTMKISYSSFDRYRKRKSGKPKFKSSRNKLKSFVIPQRFSINGNRLKLPDFGLVKYFNQELPSGKIKQVKIIKKASGWYACLIIDTINTFPTKETSERIGIDTGFKDLAILSNGVKFENNREFIKQQTRLAQAQRGGNKKLSARMHERISNRRRDYNHKVSRKIVENYSEIYITNDNLRGQAKIFGKSVMDAGISQLREFIRYKSENNNRIFKLIESKNTTKTCSSCGSLSGPSGLQELNVRVWECDCGSIHDRDINSAMNILKLGLGYNLVNLKLSDKITLFLDKNHRR